MPRTVHGAAFGRIKKGHVMEATSERPKIQHNATFEDDPAVREGTAVRRIDGVLYTQSRSASMHTTMHTSVRPGTQREDGENKGELIL